MIQLCRVKCKIMNLREAQARQASFDEAAWAHEPGDETVKHQAFHLAKDLGRLATYCEALDHGKEPSSEQLDGEVIPNLFMAALRLANERGIDIEQAFEARVSELEELHTPKSG